MTAGLLRTAVWLTGGGLLAASCTYEPASGDLSAGEQLARVHCGSCHQFPEPSLLDKTSWRANVLPVMGLHLGLLDASGKESQQNLQTLLLEGNYPAQPQLTRTDWEKIKQYYEAKAPQHLDSLVLAALSLTSPVCRAGCTARSIFPVRYHLCED